MGTYFAINEATDRALAAVNKNTQRFISRTDKGLTDINDIVETSACSILVPYLKTSAENKPHGYNAFK